jgi:hypothetical protein
LVANVVPAAAAVEASAVPALATPVAHVEIELATPGAGSRAGARSGVTPSSTAEARAASSALLLISDEKIACGSQ